MPEVKVLLGVLAAMLVLMGVCVGISDHWAWGAMWLCLAALVVCVIEPAGRIS